ncbi:MAG: diguanylate cyclase [Spirochaetales bacterium]|nr:diguanylate cyclase [Spirochaetales bacterium]
MSKRILFIEKSDFFGRATKYKLETTTDFQILWYRSNMEYVTGNHDYTLLDMAIIDYNEGDTYTNSMLDICFKNKIPIVLLASKITPTLQEKMWSLQAIDYIIKGYNYSIDNIIDIITRYFSNNTSGILLVDNCIESRKHLKKLLKLHRYRIFESSNETESLEILKEHQEIIKLVIVGHNDPELNGLELTSEIRRHYSMDKLAIIGVSLQGNHSLMVQFIKSGANDFISKPFISELLYCRVIQNIKVVEYFNKIKELAIIDPLTGLNNRHFIKEAESIIIENSKRHNLVICGAMIDIDDFKAINDTWGHDAGDIVLKEISKVLKNSIRKSDIIIRYGGEEFLIIGNNLDPIHAEKFFNKLRVTIENLKINIGKKIVNVTISIGVCTTEEDNLEQIINIADKKLYEAKNSGKNRVII